MFGPAALAMDQEQPHGHPHLTWLHLDSNNPVELLEAMDTRRYGPSLSERIVVVGPLNTFKPLGLSSSGPP